MAAWPSRARRQLQITIIMRKHNIDDGGGHDCDETHGAVKRPAKKKKKRTIWKQNWSENGPISCIRVLRVASPLALLAIRHQFKYYDNHHDSAGNDYIQGRKVIGHRFTWQAL